MKKFSLYQEPSADDLMAGAASTPTDAPTGDAPPAGATETPAPFYEHGGRQYTKDELGQRMANYDRLQGEYTQARQALSEARQAIEFANMLGAHEDLTKEFREKLEQRMSGVISPPATPGPTDTSAPVNPEVLALRNEIQALKDMWARRDAKEDWAQFDTKFEGIMGRKSSDQDRQRVLQYLQQTGAADLWSSACAVFHNEFMERAVIRKQQGVENARKQGVGIGTQGGQAEGPKQPIDLSKQSQEEADALGRMAFTGGSGTDYDQYTEFGPDVG